MNKQEKLISLLLGLGLVWCFLSGVLNPPPKPEEPTEEAAVAEASTNEVAAVSNDTALVSSETAITNATPAMAAVEQMVTNAVAAAEVAKPEPPKAPVLPPVVLENDELRLELSPVGGVVTKATLKSYARGLGPVSEENPAVELDFEAPLAQLKGVPGVSEITVFTVTNATDSALTFVAGGVTRTYTLGANYKLTLEESFAEGCRPTGPNGLTLGLMARGDGDHDVLSVDSWQGDKGGAVIHHDDDDSPVKALLTGSASGGCSCGSAKVDASTPESQSVEVPGVLSWLALKNRFFVTAVAKTSQPTTGFSTTVWRDMQTELYRPSSVAATVSFADGVESRTTEFFIGPKKQAMLWDEGMKDVMEFGWWRWLCYPVVKLLNLFHAVIPNYGVAIILLTILVRLLFWPLTRKSTEGMKKMQEIQPLLKELQTKFKDNPQRLQQETFALYREKKVNPLSSCLPMLIQIPVFFALYKVLGASVELRHASFLWIADLSEPEALFASWFPFGGLNILPILMAATMYLQSKLTPSAGDPSQQRMMQIMMPLMMLWMFYNFASALSLYWTLSQVMSIIQMWMIRRKSEQKKKVFEPEIIDPPTPTRQQRRHQ